MYATISSLDASSEPYSQRFTEGGGLRSTEAAAGGVL